MKTKFILAIAIAVFAFKLAAPAGADPASDCAVHVPWGVPVVSDTSQLDYVCHKGYFSALDPVTKSPRWVAYEMTGPHTLGCFPRTGLQFSRDALAPEDDQARLADYAQSGYDLGHMAPNQDFAWDTDEQRETFSFANVSPQLPGLNRQGWERGEEIVRAWALERGDLEIYVGPIYAPQDGKIGSDNVEVPSAFYKVIIDRQTDDAIGFVMKQAPIPKGSLAPFIQPISAIESAAHLTLPRPSSVHEASTPWTESLTDWKKAHHDACSNQ